MKAVIIMAAPCPNHWEVEVGRDLGGTRDLTRRVEEVTGLRCRCLFYDEV